MKYHNDLEYYYNTLLYKSLLNFLEETIDKDIWNNVLLEQQFKVNLEYPFKEYGTEKENQTVVNYRTLAMIQRMKNQAAAHEIEIPDSIFTLVQSRLMKLKHSFIALEEMEQLVEIIKNEIQTEKEQITNE